ncbi:BRISC complex subunit FAM175B-like [Diabrotica undecimpunctata]|uniref:BRISC complex subunit FAM175B-like n=1 Tax=Diabrotica undecimpunctata TaxID=50387 RepID=UPI003B63D1DC
MYTPTSVSLSGPAFSFLLYENTKSRFHQEGFLLGELIKKETKTITDSDQQQVNISKIIKINSVVPFPQTHYFYNGTGKINKDKVREFLGNQFSKVVAWYKYQKGTNTKLTLRDRIIHRQLLELFDISPEMFTCCLLTTELSDNAATHLFSQIFVRCNSLGCDNIPVVIPNLSESNNMYKSSETSSETFKKILGDLKIDKRNTQGLVIINKIQNALQKHIDTLVTDLAESEKYLYELEKEVSQLEIYKKVKKKNSETLDSANDWSGDHLNNSQTSNNSKDPLYIEAPSQAESSPDVNAHVPVKKQTAVRGRGRGKRGSKE